MSEKIIDLIDEMLWPAKDRKEMIGAVESLRFDDWNVRLPTEEEIAFDKIINKAIKKFMKEYE